MLDKTAVESMADEEISKAIDLLALEASRRELEDSRFRKASLAKSCKRDHIGLFVDASGDKCSF